MRKETLLIIPAYNEEMNIENTLDALLKTPIHKELDILVINDKSTDATLSKLRKYEPEVRVIDQVFNMGYGAALQTGYKYAADNGYSYLLQMDADGQHDPRCLERVLKRLKGETGPSGLAPKKKACVKEDKLPDIVIGSRFLEGAETFRISTLKKMAIGFFVAAIRGLTGYRLTDPTSGLQGLNRKAFCYYAGYSNFDIRYPDLNMIIQMLLLGFHVEEVPAIMHERMAGVSMHAGLYNSMKYMGVMVVSTFNAYTRNYKVFAHRKEISRQ